MQRTNEKEKRNQYDLDSERVVCIMGIGTGKNADRIRGWIKKANDMTPKTKQHKASTTEKSKNGNGGGRNA
ncbi:hypothetical protein EEL32_16035 [Brevibacillus laterosporus]|nr:hypothetical protein [Brevibacillus laterosporus]RAP28644.1 hypothetical protein C2W64_04700 [Brevibacillus laterosporus]TPG84276.1 hypothetical protein EEL32_16035 [Brevibacillus laterosporus]